MQESKTYEPKVLILLAALFLAVIFSSCSPTPSYSSPAKKQRCLAFVSASWCTPCKTVKDTVFPTLKANGIEIREFNEHATASIHVVDIDRDAKSVASWSLDGSVPVTVVFEGDTIVERRYGVLSEQDFYALLGRGDLLNHDPPAELAESDETRSTNDINVEAVPVAESAKSPWDQLVEIIGCDTAVLTLTIPNGRKIVIEEANAAAHVPETLTARVKVVGDAIQIDFDKPQVQAEGKKWGIRVSTNIPSATLAKDFQSVRVSSGLGIPFVWKLENHPFGDSVSNPDYDKDD